MSWEVNRRTGTVGELHHADLSPERRAVWIFDVTGPGVALGSTQSIDVLEPAAVSALGADVTTRRSGGGLVVVLPGAQAWVDVVVPRDDPLWSEDVGDAFAWLGDAWVASLASIGIAALVAEPAQRRGGGNGGPGALICFAGLGAGEVTVAGRKVVGMSQRRGRFGARFQCIVHETFDPELHLGLLRPERRDESLASLLRSTVGVVDDVVALTDALLTVLRHVGEHPLKPA